MMAPKLRAASVRADASRAVTKGVVARELMLVSMLSRFWPAHLMVPRIPQVTFPWLVCLHSPAGQLVWRLSDDELPLFAHLKREENHGKDYQGTDKAGLMLLLACEGWE